MVLHMVTLGFFSSHDSSKNYNLRNGKNSYGPGDDVNPGWNGYDRGKESSHIR